MQGVFEASRGRRRYDPELVSIRYNGAVRFCAAAAVVLVVFASPARAEDEPCAAERAEAAQVPPSAEDVRAYHDCLDKRRAAQAAEAAALEAARQKTEEDARAEIERARDARERPLRDARGLVVLGSILLGTAGIVATVAGGIGLDGLVAPAPKSTDGNGIALGMGMLLGIAGGAVMIPGVVLLALGGRDHARARRATATASASPPR